METEQVAKTRKLSQIFSEVYLPVVLFFLFLFR